MKVLRTAWHLPFEHKPLPLGDKLSALPPNQPFLPAAGKLIVSNPEALDLWGACTPSPAPSL